MENTFERIQKESKERQLLWRKSGQAGLSKSETQRVQSMTIELANLWDSYRREFASSDSPANQY